MDGRWMGGGCGECVRGSYEQTTVGTQRGTRPAKAKTFRVEGLWMGGRCGEGVWVCYEGTLPTTTPLHKGRAAQKQNLPSRGIPGRFLSLVLISPNLA